VLSEQIMRSVDNPVGAAVPKNLVVTVRTITPPSVKEYSSDMERQIASIRTAALVVEKVEPYRDGSSAAPDASSPSSNSTSTRDTQSNSAVPSPTPLVDAGQESAVSGQEKGK